MSGNKVYNYENDLQRILQVFYVLLYFNDDTGANTIMKKNKAKR